MKINEERMSNPEQWAGHHITDFLMEVTIVIKSKEYKIARESLPAPL